MQTKYKNAETTSVKQNNIAIGMLFNYANE